MAHQQGRGPGGLLVAFVAGAVTGAAIALLFAPATGEDTREYLGERARDGRERAAEAARQAQEILNQQREELASVAQRARDRYQASAGKGDQGA